MTRHVILAYGRETELWRATFAVLSFYAWLDGDRSNVRTVVFTDQPEFFAVYFEGLPVDYFRLTPALLEEMRGPQQYIHRVKLGVIDQVFKDYPGDNLLFCDSDTFFVTKASPLLQRISPEVSFMHLREFNFEEAVGIYANFVPANQERFPRKLIDLIESRTFRVASEERRFTKTQYVWNSGVLGLHHNVARLMPEICDLNDSFFAGSGWNTTEQIAFSLALPFKTKILPSDQYVFHYWGQHQKQMMDGLLLAKLNSPHFLSSSLPERMNQVQQLTLKWWRDVKLNLAREGALYALSNGELKAGMKCAAKAILAAPFDTGFAKDLFQVCRKRLSLKAS